MAVPNGLNPSFEVVKAKAFATPQGVEGSFGGGLNYKGVGTNRSTRTDVFGTTIGFAGTLYTVRVTSTSAANAAVIDVVGNDGTICRVTKGTIGGVTGCFIKINGVAGTAFAAGGSIKVSVNSTLVADDCFVELGYTVKGTENL